MAVRRLEEEQSGQTPLKPLQNVEKRGECFLLPPFFQSALGSQRQWQAIIKSQDKIITHGITTQ